MALRYLSTQLIDRKRKRLLSLEIFLPRAAGLRPAIIFSHGGGVPTSNYHYLARHWSARGFICLLPTHEGKGETLRPGAAESDRPRDMRLILDSLGTIQKKLPPGLRVDPARIGLAGHSLGAHTTLLLAGASPEFSDQRIGACLLLSPPGIGFQGLSKARLRALRPPILTVTGSRDKDATNGNPPSWRKAAHRFGPKQGNGCVSIPGATHFSFMDALIHLPGGRVQLPDLAIQRRTLEISTRFWQAQLGDKRARSVSLAGEPLGRRPALRSSLSAAKFQREYAKNRRVVIPDFLEPEFAKCVIQALEAMKPELWYDCADPEDSIYNRHRFQRYCLKNQKLHRAFTDHRKLPRRPAASELGRGSPVVQLSEWLNSDQIHRFMSQLIGQKLTPRHLFCFASRFRPGDFNGLHNDGAYPKRIAFVLYLSRQWRSSWGGNLVMRDGGGRKALIKPAFNQLVVFEVPIDHEVSRVRSGARADRYALAGWYHDYSRECFREFIARTQKKQQPLW